MGFRFRVSTRKKTRHQILRAINDILNLNNEVNLASYSVHHNPDLSSLSLSIYFRLYELRHVVSTTQNLFRIATIHNNEQATTRRTKVLSSIRSRLFQHNNYPLHPIEQ